jgi:glycosyltransferase involved in cell wall biosynthesis
MNILILHSVVNPKETRRTTLNHLLFLPKYAPEHRYTFHRAWEPVSQIALQQFDLMVLDTTFLCWRWSRPRQVFDDLRGMYDFVRRSEAVKVAFPQDEYDHSDILDEWLADWRVDVIYSSCFRDKALFYDRATTYAEIVEGFTGYVDDVDIELGKRFSRPFRQRRIDVGYRARDLGAYFGRIGNIKSVLGCKFAEAAAGSGLRIDVSTRPEDTIVGDAWLQFIGDCRFTLGSDSGSSLLDRRGEIKDAILAYMAAHPQAEFDEVEKVCFAGLDGKHVMTALSPRLFEAAIGGSCPLLVRGWYSGALESDLHYIPIEPDFSNLRAVIDRLCDREAAARMAERCFSDLISSERFRYSNLARSVLQHAAGRRHRPDTALGGLAAIAAREQSATSRLETQPAGQTDLESQTPPLDPMLQVYRQLGANGLWPLLRDMNRQLLNVWWRERSAARCSAAARAQETRNSEDPTTDPNSSPVRSGHGYSVCLLSLSCIPDDPRIRRQGDAFHDAGWSVTAVGAPGGGSPPPRWRVLTPEPPRSPVLGPVPASSEALPTDNSTLARLDRFMRQKLKPYPRLYDLTGMLVRLALRGGIVLQLLHFLAAMRRTVRAIPGLLQSLLWAVRRRVPPRQDLLWPLQLRWRPETGPERYLAQPTLQQLLAVASNVETDLYLANDWHTLPIAMRLASEKQRLFAYDTHEYALEEFRYRRHWRHVMRPLVKSIESQGLAGALIASTVSEGIARDVAKAYGLPKPLLVIRNVPQFYPAVYRPCGERITVLFHGLLVPDRGLEACVESIALWRREVAFAMRGPIEPAFREKLEEIINRCGVRDRVSFLPPVPMVELVREATRFDIGIFTPPRSSKHNIYSLPNKFFEYVQAGLAVVISNVPDMARLVRQYDLGIIVEDAQPRAIAKGINSLTRERIDAYKQNALRAARQLNWQNEGRRMVAAYEQAMAAVKAPPTLERDAAAE